MRMRLLFAAFDTLIELISRSDAYIYRDVAIIVPTTQDKLIYRPTVPLCTNHRRPLSSNHLYHILIRVIATTVTLSYCERRLAPLLCQWWFSYRPIKCCISNVFFLSTCVYASGYRRCQSHIRYNYYIMGNFHLCKISQISLPTL